MQGSVVHTGKLLILMARWYNQSVLTLNSNHLYNLSPEWGFHFTQLVTEAPLAVSNALEPTDNRP